jgi:hypothetical protein
MGKTSRQSQMERLETSHLVKKNRKKAFRHNLVKVKCQLSKKAISKNALSARKRVLVMIVMTTKSEIIEILTIQTRKKTIKLMVAKNINKSKNRKK